MMKGLESLVELKVPVHEGYVSVVRLLVSGLGTRMGLPVEEIENLKLVIGEAFLTIVDKCRATVGLIHLRWRELDQQVTVSLSDPSGLHKQVMSAANLALLSRLGVRQESSVEDGVERLDLNFEVKYVEDRPTLFHEPRDGRA